MRKIMGFISKLEEYVAGVLMVAIVVVIFAQVVYRYVLSSPLSWSEELGRYLFVWISFLGASIAFKKGAHLGIDVFTSKLSEKYQNYLAVIVNVLGIIFLAMIVKESAGLLERVVKQVSPAMRISMKWPYLALPVCTSLMLLHLLENTVERVKKIFSSQGKQDRMIGGKGELPK
ncbi:TRAP transporter small permease [Thermanaerosceptrum fracticalcis]|uniref:TRAP transporter small permease n=1 Tax=Thermanaerosceptrum fracticalcis TaxID=1712410 RepID=UPI00068E1B6E|nr:TRAP transporter small permease [Thermanaerosceptrum fracticalcis]